MKFSILRSGVGTSSPLVVIFYCQVTDEHKVGPGGGLVEEGEMIEVFEIPVKDALEFVMNEDYNRPSSMILAILWYFQYKAACGTV